METDGVTIAMDGVTMAMDGVTMAMDGVVLFKKMSKQGQVIRSLERSDNTRISKDK